jgi:diaminopimelate epimerase
LFNGAASVLKEIKKDSKNRYYLIDNCGNGQRITVKKLYKKVFKKEFSIDEIESFNNEEWKPIADTEYKYFVSNYGRIKSYCGNNAIVLKPYLNSEGYYEVKIKGKNAKIH